jgi:hypothetical protein
MKKFPDKPWEAYGLECNPNFIWDMVDIVPALKSQFNMFGISSSKAVTWDIITSNPNLPWDWFMVSQNPNITFEIVKENLDKPWVFSSLAKNKNVTFDDIRENTQFNWRDKGPIFDVLLAENPNITWDIVEEFPQYRWFPSFSYNESLKLSDVESNLDRDWSWMKISRRDDLTWDFVERNLSQPWWWNMISARSFITVEIVEKNWDLPGVDFNPTFLDDNINITRKAVRNSSCPIFSNLSFDREDAHISLEELCDKIEKNEPIDWGPASSNTHLNHRIIEHYHGSEQAHWDWNWMSNNLFSYHNPAVKIQRMFRKKKPFLRWKRAIKNVNNEFNCTPYIRLF